MTAQPEEQPSQPPAPEWELVVTLPGNVPIRIDRVSAPGRTKLRIGYRSQIDARKAGQQLTIGVQLVPKPE